MNLGKYNELEVIRKTSIGFYLSDGKVDILLPNKYVDDSVKIGNTIDVFVYLDYEERPIATTLKPYATVDSFAYLRVNYCNEIGAFLDWGLEKDIFVPFAEQQTKMKKGEWYIIYIYLDLKTNRIVGSNKFNKFINKDVPSFKESDEVDILITHFSEIGVNVIVNNTHKGLIFKNDFLNDKLKIGSISKAFVKKIRIDNKVDIVFKKPGYDSINNDADIILNYLKSGKGILKLSDESSPEDIKAVLKMSKKTFKKAIGKLYKEQLITIYTDKIVLK